jgi:serine phosphatase RsbU (regulator of sigma subunit)
MTAAAGLLDAHRAQLDVLASAWLASGAAAFGVWSNGSVLQRWPEGASLTASWLVAPIKVNEQTVGELRVSGLTGEDAQIRLAAEAGVIAQLAQLGSELDGMTDALIDSQDQLLALYDLARSMRSLLGIDETLQALVHTAARLVKSEHAIVVFVPADAPPTVVHYPSPILDDTWLFAFCEQAQRAGRITQLSTGEQADRLPAGVRSLLFVPIQISEGATASLFLLNKPESDFASPDLKLARAIAEQVGAHIQNVLLHEESLKRAALRAEMELARRVQVQLLPQEPPTVSGLEVFGASKPALQVGGDFYDFVLSDDGVFTFAVGDVTGKGMSAAMLMAMIRTMTRSVASQQPVPTPQEIVGRSNAELYDDLTDVGKFVTLFVGQYAPSSGRLLYANDGHSPVVYCPAGGPAHILEADGTAVGVLPMNLCEDQCLVMEADDVLVVATDGFSEAHSETEEMLGYERLLALVEGAAGGSAAEIGHALLGAVQVFAAEHPQDDDQTLIVVKKVAERP